MNLTVQASGAPAAIGPYSHAVWAGDLLFTSGQIPLAPETGELVVGGIAEQTEQVMCNLEAVLAAAGLAFENVVKTTVFITDLQDFGVINEIYGKRFPTSAPARSCVQVAALPKGAKLEIELIAKR